MHVRENKHFSTQKLFYQANKLALGWTAMAVIPCELGAVATVRTELGFLGSMNLMSPARLEKKTTISYQT